MFTSKMRSGTNRLMAGGLEGEPGRNKPGACGCVHQSVEHWRGTGPSRRGEIIRARRPQRCPGSGSLLYIFPEFYENYILVYFEMN